MSSATQKWNASDRNGISDPFEHAVALTLSDTVDLATPSRGLYVGVAGAVKVDMVGSGTVEFADMPVGFYPLRVKRAYATTSGTAASSLVALW
jgi:hypothetical protein